MSITRVYWIVFILSHFFQISCRCIYLYIYIYNVGYIHSVFVIFNCNVFSALHAKYFKTWKNILWNWWVDCFIVQSVKWCDILGIHSESIFPLMQYFSLSRKLCFLRSPCPLLIAESISFDTSGKPTVRFFLKTASSSWIILPISLDELNSSDWLLKSWWWVFSK